MDILFNGLIFYFIEVRLNITAQLNCALFYRTLQLPVEERTLMSFCFNPSSPLPFGLPQHGGGVVVICIINLQ